MNKIKSLKLWGSTHEIEVNKDSSLGRAMSGSVWAYIDGVRMGETEEEKENRLNPSIKELTARVKAQEETLIWLAENKYHPKIISAKKEDLAELERKLALAKRKKEDALNKPLEEKLDEERDRR